MGRKRGWWRTGEHEPDTMPRIGPDTGWQSVRLPPGRPRLAPGTRFTEHVRSVQVFLDHDLAIDGVYGPATETAVARFQRSVGVPVTGIVDEPTWQRIGALLREAS